MTILISIIIAILFIVGLLGTILPGLPGVGLVYAGILVYAFTDGFVAINQSTVVYLGILTVIASLAQYFGSLWATKSAGGKKKALIGTFVGALLGTFAGPAGIFLGAFLGALLGALMEGSTPDAAARVALQSVIGIISGSIIQFFLAIVLIIAFLVAIFA